MLIAYILYIPCRKIETTYKNVKKIKWISKKARPLSILTVYIIAFIEALVTVRKQENMEDPNKFPFSKDKIKEIIKKTHNLYFLDSEDENHFHEAVNRFIQDLGLESKFEEAKVRIHE